MSITNNNRCDICEGKKCAPGQEKYCWRHEPMDFSIFAENAKENLKLFQFPKYNINRKVPEESSKTYRQKIESGFFDKYMSGKGLDIGYAGYIPGVVSILESAIGIDLHYPGYDGRTLPFEDNSQDYCYSSHFLEHVTDRTTALQEQLRVTKVGGYVIIVVPSKLLYEKKDSLPSLWNEDHKVFYQPSNLLKEIEDALQPNSYRVRHMRENDEHHDYNQPVTEHSKGQYEIEIVLQKIK